MDSFDSMHQEQGLIGQEVVERLSKKAGVELRRQSELYNKNMMRKISCVDKIQQISSYGSRQTWYHVHGMCNDEQHHK